MSILLLIRILLVLAFAQIVCRAFIIHRLRTVHNNVWLNLGGPTLFGAAKPSTQLLKSMWFGGSAGAIEDKVFFALICIHQVIAISILGLALSMFGMGIVGADRS